MVKRALGSSPTTSHRCHSKDILCLFDTKFSLLDDSSLFESQNCQHSFIQSLVLYAITFFLITENRVKHIKCGSTSVADYAFECLWIMQSQHKRIITILNLTQVLIPLHYHVNLVAYLKRSPIHHLKPEPFSAFRQEQCNSPPPCGCRWNFRNRHRRIHGKAGQVAIIK